MKVYIKDIIHYHPEGILNNELFESNLETTADWIIENVGIKERRFLNDYRGDTPVFEMSRRVIDYFERERGYNALNKIDCIICAGTFLDKYYPTTSQMICQHYKKNIPNYQILGGCTALLQALLMASDFIKSKRYEKIAIINSEPMTNQVDYGDRKSCILFGDASNILIISGHEGLVEVKDIDYTATSEDLVGNYNYSDTCSKTLYEFATGKKEKRKNLIKYNEVMSSIGKFYQEGKEISKFIYENIPDYINTFLKKNFLKTEDISHIIYHQANLKILKRLNNECNFNSEKHLYNIDRYGNTASAGWGTVLSEFLNNSDTRDTQILISSFGVGMSYGNILLKDAR